VDVGRGAQFRADMRSDGESASTVRAAPNGLSAVSNQQVNAFDATDSALGRPIPRTGHKAELQPDEVARDPVVVAPPGVSSDLKVMHEECDESGEEWTQK